ncbi:VirK/YbjX family protein [Kushneria indalinina]|uniref:DUF535 domain-containing protein n=1 Tax=Kushneria indalinina DSM 14324 TaxID=1122140 RepID=A0A3D9DV66_9GAMM|nr:DUF535 family protein [Kushneria indalinina]REC94670.1 hypothetical protein C8D72_1496 [Kushneria indalinina DSM 14324]
MNHVTASLHWERLSSWHAARHVYPRRREWKMRYKMFMRASLHRSVHRSLLMGVSLNPLLEKAVTSRANLLNKPFRPYISIRYGHVERLRHLLLHYQMQRQLLSEDISARIMQRPGVWLGECVVGGETANIYLGYRGAHDKEGEMMLMIIRPPKKRLYSAALSFMRDAQGHPALCLGTVQGSRQQSDWNRQFTRDHFGLRPQSLMVELTQMLARTLGMDDIYCVDNAHHIYRARPNGSRQRGFDLDALIIEHGGEVDAPGWIALPAEQRRKPVEVIASKKRSMYRKRYAWLDALETQVTQALIGAPEAAPSGEGPKAPAAHTPPLAMVDVRERAGESVAL